MVEPGHTLGGRKHDAHIAPVPRISLQAFCESADLAATISDATVDRRMDKAHIKVQMGGAPAAIEAYRNAPTPNVIVLESAGDRSELRRQLEELSEFCDSGTRVVVVGKTNDISLYRELMGLGVSEYLISPFAVIDFIEAISNLYNADGHDHIGRLIAFIGAKGGVGASCIAHNVGWTIARDLELQTVIADFDLPFGTAGLDFNQDPPQGIAEAIYAPDRVDANLIDRLLSKCTDRLSLLAASAMLDRTADLDETAFDLVIDILRASVPAVILDVPHMWTSWSKRVLTMADEVVVVAGPDLANLRNAKGLIDVLKAARPNDRRPHVVLNGVGLLKRPEIDPSDFAKAVETEPLAAIPFDAKLFGTATNNGQMIAEVDAANPIAAMVSDIARVTMRRAEIKRVKKRLIPPIVERFIKRKAS